MYYLNILKILDIKSNSYCHFSEICMIIKKEYDKLKKYYIKTDKSYIYPIVTSVDNSDFCTFLRLRHEKCRSFVFFNN